ncbi:hypothetical protein MYX75_01625 [Acidobacteria bacterium AH-259-A15]|nr:hypothetical protein [Acidobacteria bacterium AH-259-A15]
MVIRSNSGGGRGAGTVLEEIKESNPGTAKSRRQFLREINEDLKHYYDLLESAGCSRAGVRNAG